MISGAVMSAIWLMMSGFFGITAVGAGAYGWHALGEDDAIRHIFMMGVDYQMWHALALLGVSWIAARPELSTSWLPLIAGVAFSLGILLFSGTLYLFAVLGYVVIDGVAPSGGFLMMAGWAMMTLCGWKTRKKTP